MNACVFCELARWTRSCSGKQLLFWKMLFWVTLVVLWNNYCDTNLVYSVGHFANKVVSRNAVCCWASSARWGWKLSLWITVVVVYNNCWFCITIVVVDCWASSARCGWKLSLWITVVIVYNNCWFWITIVVVYNDCCGLLSLLCSLWITIVILDNSCYFG